MRDDRAQGKKRHQAHAAAELAEAFDRLLEPLESVRFRSDRRDDVFDFDGPVAPPPRYPSVWLCLRKSNDTPYRQLRLAAPWAAAAALGGLALLLLERIA